MAGRKRLTPGKTPAPLVGKRPAATIESCDERGAVPALPDLGTNMAMEQMDQLERFYIIHQMLDPRETVSIDAFLERLGVEEPVLRADIEEMRGRFNAPILWDRKHEGYRFTEQSGDGPRYELPGIWFNSSEAHALLAMHALLCNLEPGLLAPHVDPLRERIENLLESAKPGEQGVLSKIRLLSQGKRKANHRYFAIIATAVLHGTRLVIQHYNRREATSTQREVSPQRLVYYRDNWYLDAWCHQREALRTFAIDAMERASLTAKPAKSIPDEELDRQFGAGYGIFGGEAKQRARLRFEPTRARWVSSETWHPNQNAYWEGEHYILEVPYSDDRELMMDILKYGAGVEVLEPAELREKVAGEVENLLRVYRE